MSLWSLPQVSWVRTLFPIFCPRCLGSFYPTTYRTCNESSEEQNGAGSHQVAADDESREDESVDEAALVVDRAAVEGFPEVQIVAEVLRQEVWKDAKICMQ